MAAFISIPDAYATITCDDQRRPIRRVINVELIGSLAECSETVTHIYTRDKIVRCPLSITTISAMCARALTNAERGVFAPVTEDHVLDMVEDEPPKPTCACPY